MVKFQTLLIISIFASILLFDHCDSRCRRRCIRRFACDSSSSESEERNCNCNEPETTAETAALKTETPVAQATIPVISFGNVTRRSFVVVPPDETETEAPVTEATEETASDQTEEPVSEQTEEPATEQTEETEEPATEQTEETEEPATEQTEEPASEQTEETEEPASDQTEEPTGEQTDQTDEPSINTNAPNHPPVQPSCNLFLLSDFLTFLIFISLFNVISENLGFGLAQRKFTKSYD